MTDDGGGGARRFPLVDRDADEEAAVVRFLADRPDFLARHPSLYLTLAPPARVHGERLADHMAALLGAARRQNALLADGVRRRREDASFGVRVEAALLGVIRSVDPLEWMGTELGPTLGIDSAAICLEVPHRATGLLAPGEAARLLAGRDIRFRPDPGEAAAIHGETAPLVRRDVLVRLRPGCGAGLLALGSRDDALPGPGAERALSLLARAVEAALERP